LEEVRREIEGEVYATWDEKVMAVQKFLTDLESDPEGVRSLTWWDWIEAAARDSQSIMRRD
jgi:hypothetical protein